MLPKKKKNGTHILFRFFKLEKNQLMIYMRKIKIEKQKKFEATNYSQKNRIGPKLELI